MKKIFFAVAILISIQLLGACDAMDKEGEVSIAVDIPDEQVASQTQTPSTSASEPPSVEESLPFPSPEEQTQLQRWISSFAYPVETPIPRPQIEVNLPTLESVLDETEQAKIAIDESYFNILHVTYSQMVETFGSSQMWANQEIGLNAVFDNVQVACRFDISMAQRHYENFDEWIMDKSEFDFLADGSGQLAYIGDKFAPVDFEVSHIEIYGTGVNRFFGFDEAITMDMVIEHFGWEEVEINFNEMYDRYSSSVQNYGEYNQYGINFDITLVDGDYIIDTINISRRPME